MTGDLFEILFVVAFILFGILGGRKKKPDATPTGEPRPRPPAPRRYSQGGPPVSRKAPQTAQDALMRELEGLLTGRRPAGDPGWSPVPGDLVPDPAEARSLETLEVEETATWEEGLERASDVRGTARWQQGRDRSAATLETMEEAGEGSHRRYHQRYAVAPVPPTATPQVPTFDMHDLRQAVIWSEILDPPVSLR